MMNSIDEASEDGGMTALHIAAMQGNLEQVRGLLSDGADPNQLNSRDEPPIFCVFARFDHNNPEVKAECEAVFRLLWSEMNEATRACQDAIGQTVLHRMACAGADALVPDVLKSVPSLAEKKKRVRDQEHPIHTAILNSNRLALIEAFCEYDDNTLSYENKNGQKALHLAACWGSREQMQYICERTGALNDVLNEVDGAQKTVIELAAEYENIRVQAYLDELMAEMGPTHGA